LQGAAPGTAAVTAPAELIGQLSGPLQGLTCVPFEALQRVDAAQAPLWVVVDPEDEGARLAALRRQYPALRFAGLGEDLFAALVARRPRAVFAPAPPAPRQLCLIVAPPRSGSSLVADLCGHMTGTKCREHLRRDTVSGLLDGPYRFDRTAALRRFLGLIASPKTGWATTKTISHFLLDVIWDIGGLQQVRAAAQGMDTRVIVLDREDHVAQGVSGFLASERKLWHLEKPADAEALAARPAAAYDFDGIMAHYMLYRAQSPTLEHMREVFPDHLGLEYGRDIEDGDLGRLGARIAGFLGVAWQPADAPVGRQRMANDENHAMAARFRRDYRGLFGCDP